MRPSRVLMVSPHFPPDSSAAAHRVRLLAPHLAEFGWEPTIVAVDPRDCEGRLDPGLERLVPPDLRIIRCRAWPVRWTRRIGVGDLGLRAWHGLRRTCTRLLRQERFDALFITVYPVYPARLGRILKRRFGVPFVLDYQDPWVGAWGLSVGGGPGGAPDLKSRISRQLGRMLEPGAVRAADAITAVSAGICEEIARRIPDASTRPQAVIPLGWEPCDFAGLDSTGRNRWFDPADGQVHLCYVGTLLPTGFETLRLLLTAVARLRDREPDLYARLQLWFLGTSNQSSGTAPDRVRPLAEALGVAARVHEVPARVPYLEALAVLTQADGILLLGNTEPHYTASKLCPALLARRPLLALFHDASSVVEILRRAGREPTVRVVTYDAGHPPMTRLDAATDALAALIRRPAYGSSDVDLGAIEDVSARGGARALAGLLDRVTGRGPAA
ncbi:MAG TPA: glycosyltransferase [Vicinamibacterales bacterium]|nr:glycosyltransferase [Vicinamibacterales bacterium]